MEKSYLLYHDFNCIYNKLLHIYLIKSGDMEDIGIRNRMNYSERMVRSRDSGRITFNPTEIADPPNNILPNFVCIIEGIGTGFVIAKSSGRIIVDGEEIKGLILTAAHMFCNFCTKEFKDTSRVRITFNRSGFIGDSYCIPLIHMLNEPEISMQSITSLSKYCLSNDLAICAIIGDVDISELSTPTIASPNEITKELDCSISGHPFKPLKTSYLYPANDITQEDLKRLASSVFNNYERQIVSFGKILEKTDNCIETTCCTAGGMSGSPVLAQISNQNKLIGIHLGGPPLPYQYEVLRAMQELVIDKNRRVYLRGIRRMIARISKEKIYGNYFARELERLIEVLQRTNGSIPTQDMNKLQEYTEDIIYSMVENHTEMIKDPYVNNFNIALSVANPVFQKAVSCVRQFENLRNICYNRKEFIDMLMQ